LKEYDSFDVAAREKFFELTPDDAAYVNTLNAHLDKGESLFFCVRRKIVNRVIGNLLFDSTESDEKVDGALNILEEDGAGEARVGRFQRSELNVTMRKVLAFSLVIEYVGAGQSFRQASDISSSTTDRTRLDKLRGMRENEVVKFVNLTTSFSRAVVGVNLRAVEDLLKNRECWAFSLAYGGVTIQGRSLLGVRVRLAFAAIKSKSTSSSSLYARPTQVCRWQTWSTLS
jgi:hypothetical protein